MSGQDNALLRDAALVSDKPADPTTDRWLRLWLVLNQTETPRDEERARRLVRETFETHLSLTRGVAKHHAAQSENGLGDD
jgi:hypothetical protein